MSNEFALCYSIHEKSGSVVLGMNGPFIVFNSRDDAADYLVRLATAIREPTTGSKNNEVKENHV